MKKNIILLNIIILFLTVSCYSQEVPLRVLFLGNSYTGVNNLPLLTANLTEGTNNTLIVESNIPGGSTLEDHSTNSASLNKIMEGVWDFVVLQEQSQIPTIPYYKENSMYPAIERLHDSIKKYNPCANVVTYMTWGRRYGGMQCDQTGTYCSPDFVDFSHMQDSLETAYVNISNEISAYISPVGMAWKKVIEDTTIVLHANDDSHPNLNGSYLAACVFHSVFWNESPVGLSYNAGLTDELALYFQKIADSIVFNNDFNWNINIDIPEADFDFEVFGDSVQFTNLSNSFELVSWFWDFGDSTTSTLEHPSHIYTSNQNYEVSLIVNHCSKSDTITNTVSVLTIGTDEISDVLHFSLYPNPVTDDLYIKSEANSLNYEIEIINLMGSIVYSTDSSNGVNLKINLENLLQGIYVVKISEVGGKWKGYKILKR